MVSIKDVARVAGVSDKTVSRVVNGEPNVTADTIEKVQLAIADLGYIPNLAARSIRSNRTNIIGIITDFISTTPYSGDIVRGVQDWAGANGRTVLLANTDGDPTREANVWRTFKAHREAADGDESEQILDEREHRNLQSFCSVLVCSQFVLV